MAENKEAKIYTNITIDEKGGSEVAIRGAITEEAIARYRDSVIENLAKNMTVPGFRKGHVPHHIVTEKVGEQKILEEVAEKAISDAYPRIIAEHTLSVIGYPQVNLTKLAPGNPIEFVIETAVTPTLTLPDYQTIAKTVMAEKDDLEVTDADVEKVLTEIRRGKARMQKIERAQDTPSEEKTISEEKTETAKEEELPPLDDEFVATLGNFKTVDEFVTRVREDIEKDKKMRARDKKRVALSEQLVEKTTIEIPNVLIENELDKMMAQMEDDVARMQMKFDDYLSHTKKTREDLRNEWRDQAKKRATLQLILNEIARAEKITADHDEVHRQMDEIMKHYKDAKPENVHAYVEIQLQNEAVFQFLEKQQ